MDGADGRLELRWLSARDALDDAARADLLQREGLDPDDTPPDAEILEAWRGSRLAATGARSGSLIRQVAVRPEERGRDLLALVVTELRRRMLARGVLHCRVYTKPERRDRFEPLGFRVLARAGGALLMESGPGGLPDFLDGLRALRPAESGPAGCVVMHANPFTLGHRRLVERTLERCGRACVFLLRGEGRSLFPYATRRELALRGLEGLPETLLLDGGDYLIPTWAFPRYFLKQADERARTQAELDVDLFRRHVAPALGVNARFAGEEPEDELTALYNRTMERLLPPSGVAFTVLPRLRDAGGAIISAGRVRRRFLADRLDEARDSLPASTFEFLAGPEGRALRERFLAKGAAHA